jgi:hypothetical protein
MPASGHPALILSTATAVGTVVAAFVVLGLTRLIVRFAAEPDRRGPQDAPVSASRLERGR